MPAPTIIHLPPTSLRSWSRFRRGLMEPRTMCGGTHCGHVATPQAAPGGNPWRVDTLRNGPVRWCRVCAGRARLYHGSIEAVRHQLISETKA